MQSIAIDAIKMDLVTDFFAANDQQVIPSSDGEAIGEHWTNFRHSLSIRRFFSSLVQLIHFLTLSHHDPTRSDSDSRYVHCATCMLQFFSDRC